MLNHSNYMQMNAQLFNELSTQQCENVSPLRSAYIRVPRGFNSNVLNITVHTIFIRIVLKKLAYKHVSHVL